MNNLYLLINKSTYFVWFVLRKIVSRKYFLHVYIFRISLYLKVYEQCDGDSNRINNEILIKKDTITDQKNIFLIRFYPPVPVS